MAITAYRIENYNRLMRDLRLAGATVEDMKRIHKKAAAIAEAEVKRVTPRGDTGNLLSSVRSVAFKGGGYIRAGNKKQVPYANPIQWGWPRRKIKPSYFATSGVKEGEPSWVKVYEEEVERAISKIKG
ncbi:HK97 gp10 family phage protein [Dermabacteraceae bacterium P7006]